MEPLGPSTGFREHVVALNQELTDEVVELATAWARYRWGTSASVRRVEPGSRTLVIWAPDTPSVGPDLAAAIAKGERPSLRPGARKKPRRRV